MNFAPALITEEHPLELKGELPPETLALDEASAKAREPILVDVLVIYLNAVIEAYGVESLERLHSCQSARLLKGAIAGI